MYTYKCFSASVPHSLACVRPRVKFTLNPLTGTIRFDGGGYILHTHTCPPTTSVADKHQTGCNIQAHMSEMINTYECMYCIYRACTYAVKLSKLTHHVCGIAATSGPSHAYIHALYIHTHKHTEYYGAARVNVSRGQEKNAHAYIRAHTHIRRASYASRRVHTRITHTLTQ